MANYPEWVMKYKEKGTYIMDRLQEKKKEAAEAEANHPKFYEKDKDQGMGLS